MAMALDQRFLGSGFVLVDEPAEDWLTPDLAVARLGNRRCWARWPQLQRSMRPRGVVVRSVGGEHSTQVSFPEDHIRSVTSVRTVRTKRSAKQFARGHRGGILTTSIPASAITASNEAAN